MSFVNEMFPEGRLEYEGYDVSFWTVSVAEMAQMMEIAGQPGNDVAGLCIDFRGKKFNGDFAVVLCEERCEQLAEIGGETEEDMKSIVLTHELGHLCGYVHCDDNSEAFADDFAFDLLEECGLSDHGLLNEI